MASLSHDLEKIEGQLVGFYWLSFNKEDQKDDRRPKGLRVQNNTCLLLHNNIGQPSWLGGRAPFSKSQGHEFDSRVRQIYLTTNSIYTLSVDRQVLGLLTKPIDNCQTSQLRGSASAYKSLYHRFAPGPGLNFPNFLFLERPVFFFLRFLYSLSGQ